MQKSKNNNYKVLWQIAEAEFMTVPAALVLYILADVLFGVCEIDNGLLLLVIWGYLLYNTTKVVLLYLLKAK